jgi:hypothetical protein
MPLSTDCGNHSLRLRRAERGSSSQNACGPHYSKQQQCYQNSQIRFVLPGRYNHEDPQKPTKGPKATTKAQRGGQANEQAMESLVTRSLDIHQTIYSRSCCAESYSQSILPRATPGLLCRELLPSCRAESYSRAVVPRATPSLSCRELLPVCCAESYSRAVVPRATPTLSC